MPIREEYMCWWIKYAFRTCKRTHMLIGFGSYKAPIIRGAVDKCFAYKKSQIPHNYLKQKTKAQTKPSATTELSTTQYCSNTSNYNSHNFQLALPLLRTTSFVLQFNTTGIDGSYSGQRFFLNPKSLEICY